MIWWCSFVVCCAGFGPYRHVNWTDVVRWLVVVHWCVVLDWSGVVRWLVVVT